MKVYKLEDGIVVESDNDGLFYFFYQSNWDDFVNRDDLYYWIKEQIKLQQPLDKTWFSEQIGDTCRPNLLILNRCKHFLL